MSAAPPRILVVSGSAGHGHTMAGEAVTAAFRTHPVSLDVEHWDAVEGMSRAYAHIYRRAYVRLVDKHPLLWRAVYERTDDRPSALTHGLARWAGRGFVDRVRAWRPDAIVCTHFLAPEVLSKALGEERLNTTMHVVITDRDAHRTWWWPGIDRFHVATDVVGARLNLTYGVPLDAIHVSGIPIRPQFTQPSDQHAVRAEYGLDPECPVVLFLSGGFAARGMAQAIHGLWLERRDVQVLAVCGRNERMRRRIAKLPRPSGALLRALPFVRDVAGLMSVADIVVGKSGGITTAECLSMGRPFVINGAIAGQEERNALDVVGAGAGVWAPTPAEVRWQVGRLLGDPVAYQAMAAAATALGRPDAAQAIVQDVLDGLGAVGPAAGPYFHGAAAPFHGAAAQVPRDA